MSRGLAFAEAMALATWEGRKTQTRRIMNPQPHPDFLARGLVGAMPQWPQQNGVRFFMADGMSELVPSHYVPGDVCPVLEPHRLMAARDFGAAALVRYECDQAERTVALSKEDMETLAGRHGKNPERVFPGRYMLRSFSRGKVEIVGVRVERVQDISEEDALAEGITWPVPSALAAVGVTEYRPPADLTGISNLRTWAMRYKELWDVINGTRDRGAFAWARNPWCWVYTFKVVERAGWRLVDGIWKPEKEEA